MSYFEKTRILAADSPSIDAFGKWRVSNPTTLFDSKQIVDSGSVYLDTLTRTGGSVTWNSGSASSTYLVTSTSGSYALRQTKRVFVYQPGKSQQIIMTGVFGTGIRGIKKSFGIYDNNDGLFFQQSGSNFGVVLRKTINGQFSDTFVSQSSWNLDKMNGTGPSGNTLDLTKAQIFTIDFEWLGVGRIRYGVVQKGIIIYVHEITNYNSLDYVYMRNSNLPLRYEIGTYKAATTGSLLKSICSTVISEGGFGGNGNRRVCTNNSGTTISAATYGSVLRLRYNPTTSTGASLIPEQIDFLVSPGNNSPYSGRWDLLLNPTITNTPTWLNTTGSRIVQQASSVVSASAITNQGTILATGYFSGTAGGGIGEKISLDPFFAMGKKIDNTSDVLVLAVKQIDNTYTIYPSIVVRELT